VPSNRGVMPVSQGREIVQMTGIVKRFPGVLALDGVDFDVRAGEVHVLMGENGAGKSTLINIMAGTYGWDAGGFVFEGRPLTSLSPHGARQLGISPVFQEFSLVPELTVMDNLFLGRERAKGGWLKSREMQAEAQDLLDRLGFELSARDTVSDLTRARQQMVEIAKALLQDLRVLILDEPTASLTHVEAEKLFHLADDLKSKGVGIVYVSHRMSEIRQVGDRVTVLRDGRHIGTAAIEDVDDDELVEMMTGKRIDVLFPPIRHHRGSPRLQLRSISDDQGLIQDIDLEVCAGEIVGLAGLVGCGKSEAARAAFGLHPIAHGEVLLDGRSVARPTPRQMLKDKVCYFPSDRVAEGLSLPRPVRENTTKAALDVADFARLSWLDPAAERRVAAKVAEQLALQPPDPERAVRDYSGGNRQKIMLARGLVRDVEVFLFDEPTVGVDVAAKSQIYGLLRDLVEGGAAVLLVSSELPEIVHLSNRIYVMRLGRVVAELQAAEISETAVLQAMFGGAGSGGDHGDRAVRQGAGA
jgi:ribose transport system ATP-binding protein